MNINYDYILTPIALTNILNVEPDPRRHVFSFELCANNRHDFTVHNKRQDVSNSDTKNVYKRVPVNKNQLFIVIV